MKIPDMPLRQHDVVQPQAARAQHHRDDHEAHRDLVADHLRRRTQRAEERVFRVARPARHHDPIDAERADREQIEHAHVDVGDRPMIVHRDHRPGEHRQREGEHRRHQEQETVRSRRDDRLLHQHLDRVGERLQQPERPDHVRSAADLDRGQHLALGEREIGDADQQRHQQRQRLGNRQDKLPEQRVQEELRHRLFRSLQDRPHEQARALRHRRDWRG